MNLRVRLVILVAAPVIFLGSCTSPDAPVPTQGRIVMRLAAPPQAAPANAPRVPFAAPAFDSVVVSVFHAGTAISKEVSKGVALTTDSVSVSLSCVAENHKRVGVDLFQAGTMIYHGANTDVDVAANASTRVAVDVYPFSISSFTVTPSLTPEGSAFALRWSPVATAASYRVQASPTPDFGTIEWQQTATDTLSAAQLSPGSHYFRVAPQTPYTTGTFAGPQFAYVLGGSDKVAITGFGAPGAIPGDPVTIFGENLDFPGTQVRIGLQLMDIISSSWGQIVARMPRTAMTAKVSVTSTLGSAVSSDDLIAQRIAYVSSTGQYAGSFTDLMATYSTDVGGRGVASIPMRDVDTRDMSVFDVIVVASDTGTDASNWGGGSTARALAIATSGANVLAMGDGGVVFLTIVLPGYRVPVSAASQTSCYVPAPDATIFQTPYSVIGSQPGWVDICASPERELSLQNPSVTNDYATTAAQGNMWVFSDHLTTGGRYFCWGFAADPKGFTKTGQQLLVNVMNLLAR